MTERIAELADPEDEGLRHVACRDEVVRCRDCGRCLALPQGCVCTVHGSAGWHATKEERMSEKLKPCPFCGGYAEVLPCAVVFESVEYWLVKCSECEARSCADEGRER